MKNIKVCDLFEMSVNFFRRINVKKGARVVAYSYLIDRSKLCSVESVCEYYGIQLEIEQNVAPLVWIKIWK